jgi:quinohemoprotein ethanol dehydrogenase
MSYDAASHLLYVGTGNAAPYQEQGRNPSGAHGDDLYCSSILALDATNGKLAWYFQSTPGDNWDQDADAPLIQADLKIDGRLRHTLMQASKNGFFYVLDRNTGELISGKPFTYVNWARALDPSGRPLVTREANYTQEPRLIYPSAAGAHSWSPMSYNSRTHLVYIAVIDAPMIWVDLERKPVSFVDGMFGVGEVTPDKDYNPKDWEQWFGPMPRYGADTRAPRRVIRGVLRAWDPLKQQMRWQQETSHNYAVYNGGVMSMAGNLVLQGRADGALYAYRADSGELIASFKTGVGIMAAPMTYEGRGVQHIAVMEGYGGGLIGSPFPPIAAASRYVNEGRILALRLGGGPMPLPAQRADLSFSRPPAQRGSDVDIARGSSLYLTYCSRCHVFGAGVLPDLRSVLPGIDDHFEDIVLRGRLAAVGMDRFDDVLKPADVAALQCCGFHCQAHRAVIRDLTLVASPLWRT